MKALTIALLAAAAAASGCFGLGEGDCFAGGAGLMVKVEVDSSTTPPGATPPPNGAGATVLVKWDRGGSAMATLDRVKADASGCATFDTTGMTDYQMGSYEVEASIDRLPCDWHDQKQFEYDGQLHELTLILTCSQTN